VEGANHQMKGYEKEFAKVTIEHIKELIKKNKW